MPLDGRLQGQGCGAAGRRGRSLERALLAETFPLFAATVLVAHASEIHGALTEWGARLYFWARVAYVPLYASGSPIVRSPVWNVATIDTMLIIALFLGWIRTLPGAMVRTPPCLRASPRSISESNTRLTPNKLVHIVHTN